MDYSQKELGWGLIPIDPNRNWAWHWINPKVDTLWDWDGKNPNANPNTNSNLNPKWDSSQWTFLLIEIGMGIRIWIDPIRILEGFPIGFWTGIVIAIEIDPIPELGWIPLGIGIDPNDNWDED